MEPPVRRVRKEPRTRYPDGPLSEPGDSLPCERSARGSARSSVILRFLRCEDVNGNASASAGHGSAVRGDPSFERISIARESLPGIGRGPARCSVVPFACLPRSEGRERALRTTRCFEEQVLRKRPYIQREWCLEVLAAPIQREVQSDGRVRY